MCLSLDDDGIFENLLTNEKNVINLTPNHAAFLALFGHLPCFCSQQIAFDEYLCAQLLSGNTQRP
jgi:hypothetical protein